MNPERSVHAVAEMTLAQLLEGYANVSPKQDGICSGIQYDSRQLVDGDVFIALKGLTVHALDYLDSVLPLALAAVLVDSRQDRPTADEQKQLLAAGIPLITVRDLPVVAGEIVSRFYHEPSRAMQVIGVTGTDGKTSVCHLLAQALNERRTNCGLIGTLGVSLGRELSAGGLTTPDAVRLHATLAQFRDAGAGYAAMEVSSHALSQHRVAGIAFDVAVFTNLGRDHLDFHGDMKSYRLAKELLFQQPGLRAAVINADDEVGVGLIERLSELELTTYGSGARDGSQHVRYVDVVPSIDGLQFAIEFDRKQYQINSALLGKFNVENLAATFAVLMALGLGPDLAAASLMNLKAVPGRMESVRLPNGVVVIIDYAHNPHALESLLSAVKDHAGGRMLLVFGCGGDRDQGKRPLMAAVAEKYADHSVLTDDNPRTEDGDQIIEHIAGGFSSAEKYVIDRDRRSAIQRAIEAAVAGDIVIVAGKGHEDYQIIGDQRLSFSDRHVVEEYAGALSGVAES